jgi:predicted dehydrogenase
VLNRREFVGAAAAAAALGARQEQIHRVAVIGSTGRGNYGHGLDRVWLDVPRTKLVAVADDNSEGLKKAAAALKLDRAYADYREMLDKEKPQIVAIAPRWLDRHAEHFRAVAERGAHIYMEKPFCRTLEEADAMVEAAQKAGIQFALAHQTRTSPKIPVIRKIIESGRLGQVVELRGRGKEDTRGGGEDLWVLGSHVMDLVLLLAGRPKGCYATVLQDGRPVERPHVKEGNEGIGPLAGDTIHAMYTGTALGAPFTFSSVRGAGANPTRFGLQIFGSKGVLEMGTGYLPDVRFLPDPSWSPGRTGAAWQNVSSAGIGEPETLPDGGLHAGNVAAANALIDRIEKGGPCTEVLEARDTVEMIAAVFESHRIRGPVTIPLKTRKNPLTLLG